MPGPEGKACWGRGRSIVDEHLSEAKITPRELERWLGCEEPGADSHPHEAT